MSHKTWAIDQHTSALARFDSYTDRLDWKTEIRAIEVVQGPVVQKKFCH
jgi:hypothetical protein